MKRTHLKKLHIGQAPHCLCIHINRTVWAPQGSLQKNDLYMTFPMELEASKLLRRERSSAGVKYLLCAVVEHRGGPGSGHYVTYRRCGRRGKQWVCASDASVYSVTVHDVLWAKAFMLFYSRISTL